MPVDPSAPGKPETAGLVLCPNCQEGISGNASVCPRCRTSTLVDLLVDQAVADPKLRYRAARAVAGFRAGASLANLQGALGVGGARVLSGVTPGVAAACAESLAAIGVRTTPVSAATEPQAEARSWKSPGLLAIGAALAVALAALLLWPKAVSTPTGATKRGRSDAGGRDEGPALSGAELAQRGLASTVVLRCSETLGSGFFVAADRVLTNAHVLCPAGETLEVHTSDGRQGTGRPIHAKEDLDLALVQVEGLSGIPLPLGDAGSLRVGDRVVVVGAPRGMEFSVTQGGISNMDRVMLGIAYLQTDAAVNPGNSGGPMLDDRGRVVGVVSLKRMDAEGIALVLPINYAFTGQDAALVAAPPGGPSEGFARMAGAAASLNQQEVAKLASTGQRPGLVAAAVAGASIRAVVLWPSAFDPGDQEFAFALWTKKERLCSMQGALKGWRKVEGEGGESLLSGQGKAWLDKHGFSSDLYAAVTLLDYSQCPLGSVGPGSTVDLELEGADSDASRIRLQ
jgi:serine protease Do